MRTSEDSTRCPSRTAPHRGRRQGGNSSQRTMSSQREHEAPYRHSSRQPTLVTRRRRPRRRAMRRVTLRCRCVGRLNFLAERAAFVRMCTTFSRICPARSTFRSNLWHPKSYARRTPTQRSATAKSLVLASREREREGRNRQMRRSRQRKMRRTGQRNDESR